MGTSFCHRQFVIVEIQGKAFIPRQFEVSLDLERIFACRLVLVDPKGEGLLSSLIRLDCDRLDDRVQGLVFRILKLESEDDFLRCVEAAVDADGDGEIIARADADVLGHINTHQLERGQDYVQGGSVSIAPVSQIVVHRQRDDVLP